MIHSVSTVCLPLISFSFSFSQSSLWLSLDFGNSAKLYKKSPEVYAQFHVWVVPWVQWAYVSMENLQSKTKTKKLKKNCAGGIAILARWAGCKLSNVCGQFAAVLLQMWVTCDREDTFRLWWRCFNNVRIEEVTNAREDENSDSQNTAMIADRWRK